MLGSIISLNGWCCQDCKKIYRLWKWRIVKQDELGGDLEFTMIIGFGGKSSSHWKTNKRQS
jgi:hypothetical protein